jgi:predicted RNA binding protein YcfA (HicA-like mRNA interferase family)
MRIQRDIEGDELAKLLRKYGYEITRQTGGHIRLTTTLKGEHHITIPKHKPMKVSLSTAFQLVIALGREDYFFLYARWCSIRPAARHFHSSNQQLVDFR